jgi:hypothetical protein
VRSTYQADQAASSHQAFYNSMAGWLGLRNLKPSHQAVKPAGLLTSMLEQEQGGILAFISNIVTA